VGKSTNKKKKSIHTTAQGNAHLLIQSGQGKMLNARKEKRGLLILFLHPFRASVGKRGVGLTSRT